MRRWRWGRPAIVLGALLGANGEARALITGGTGNTPLNDPGWPKGAAVLFNHPGRVASWEGPPFGGGEYHSECRGDAKALNALLAGFAAMEAPTKRVVVHDGVGASFWLNPNREPGKAQDARIDWMLTVWVRSSWDQLRGLPADFNPTNPADRDVGPPAQLDIYTGGNVRWSEVVVPPGLAVQDERLEANGFNAADGAVVTGTIRDARTGAPLAGRVRLEPRGDAGTARTVEAAPSGQWAATKVAPGTYQVVAEADGYVPRVAGYVATDHQPRLTRLDAALAKGGVVAGRVVDGEGAGLAGVNVRFGHVTAAGDATRYRPATEPGAASNAEGHFRAEGLPQGMATIWVNKPGYTGPGLGQAVEVPSEGVTLTMRRASDVRVTVEFGAAKREGGYIVRLIPEGGEKVGLWSGSGEVDAEGRIAFRDVPPGRYTLSGRPNPGPDDQETEPQPVELKGGEDLERTIRAK